VASPRDAWANAGELDREGSGEDPAGVRTQGAQVRYKVGAEQMEQVPSLAQRRVGIVRPARTALVGPTHAVDAITGTVACGITADWLDVLDQDWEEAFFVENSPACDAAVAARG
jgi:hypothetical protein